MATSSPDNIHRAASDRQLLCVLGMHRSGTSAVTQLLHRLGAAVGPELLDAMAGVNDEGFWEDSRIVALDERLLAAHGLRWQDCAPPGAADPATLAAIASEAHAHFAQHYGMALGVVKDPRQCRLLPFWLRVWREAGLDVVPVHVLRHPYAVAKSLQRRDRVPFEYGVTLWLLYTLEALGYTQEAVSHSGGRPGIVVPFEAFRRQPLWLPRALAEHGGVSWFPLGTLSKDDEARWEAAATASLRPDLRHHGDELPEGWGLRPLTEFAAATYQTLVALAPALPDEARIVALHTELQALMRDHAGELGMLGRLTDEFMALSAENVRIGSLHHEALGVIRDKDKMLEERNQLIKDMAHLRFWRILPHLMRRAGRR